MTFRPGVKFGVVREDAELEQRLIRDNGARRVLLVASGGCTALSILAADAGLEVVAFDQNPAQLEHVRAKAAVAAAGDRALLDQLNQAGEFDALFRTLRYMLETFVARDGALSRFFEAPAAERRALVDAWSTDRYWVGCFASCFCDGLLHAMFGPAATQHAEPGSYPGYFAGVFERGLRRPDAARNPFLQHVLLGGYRDGDEPTYMREGRVRVPRLVLGGLGDVPELERFDLYSLSNVFDWSDDDLVAAWANRLKRTAQRGSVVLLRQLNNTRDLRRYLTPEFAFDDALGRELQASDRSLFYNRIEVARRMA